MKVWPCGLTGASNASDYFTFTHFLNAFHPNFIHMGIESSIAISGGKDGGASGRSHINSLVSGLLSWL